MTRLSKWTFLALAALLAALPLSPIALGQGLDEFGDEAATEADVVQTVARISYLQGSASYARGDEPDDWQAADLNIPMTLGDRVYTSRRSRLELQVHGGDVIWVGSRTDLTALNLTDDTKQLALKIGVASFHVRRLDENDVWEVDTPNAAVTFESAGDYRIGVDPDGNTRVSVERGNLTLSAGGGQIAVGAGEAIVVDGIDAPRYDFVAMSPPDPWDRWIDSRSGRARRSASYHYVNSGVVGAEDLDDYGSWNSIPEYGMVWSPSRVEAGWLPYRQGHWGWQDPWGWTWISSEPWGWAPYHYGRWVVYSSRWYWVPVAPSVRVVTYAPALVAFVGSGPGFSASVTIGGGGYVGWFPLAPRERYVPWWSPRPVVNVNVTNVTYINQTYVTVVNQNTFVSGGLVTRSVVTDRTVIREVSSGTVVRGAVPLVPTVASTRFSMRSTGSVARPPAAVVARPVVARIAPPPAPPRFQQKLAVIRESRKPVDSVEAAKLTTQAQRQPRAATQVRPVATESGRVTLAPRQGSASAPSGARPAPAPVSAGPVRGRPAATAQQPIASEPVTARKRAGEPARSESRTEAPRAQTAPESVRPTPALERQREVAPPPTRPATERQRMPVPPESNERVRPTPQGQSSRPGQPEGRVQQEVERPPTPRYGERVRPTPREAPPSREAAPQRESARPTPREAPPSREAAPQREQAPQSGRERVVTPPSSREVVQPQNRRPPEQPAARASERGRREPTPKPNRTPKKDDKKPDDNPN